MEQQEEWNKVDTEKKEEPKVEFEVEEEEKKEEIKEEPKQEEVKKEPEEKPKELEGIDTKGAQKRIRQLVKQRKDKEEEVARLIKQNEELAYRVQKQEQEFYKVGKLNLNANEKQIKDKLDLARTAYATAHEEGDSAKILKAQEALNEAQVDLKTIQSTKSNFQEPEVKQTVQQPVHQPQPTPDPKAEEWAAQNEWFGKDRVMTASALAIDTDLKEEGYDSTSSEFYEEINKRLHETFPNKFKTNTKEEKEIRKQDSAPAQVVAGGTRSTPSSKNKVKLSKDDVRLAEKWNIPLEQYAQEKLKATNAEGEYTTVNMQRGGK